MIDTMSKLPRRKFLKFLAVGAGAIIAKAAFPLNSLYAQVQYKDKNGFLVPDGWPANRPYWDMPAGQLEMQNSRSLKKTLDEVINPFHQPNLIYDQLNCYGGGDYDGFGIGQGDIDAAAAGINNYKLDVNGDQLINLTDANMLQAYKNGNTGYLPGYWNFLQNRGERESWLTKMLAIDKTDEKEPSSQGDDYPETNFISRDFSRLLHMNFFGFVKENSLDNDIPAVYSPLTNGLFNMPLYGVSMDGPTYGHGMNAILLGDNPLEFNDWSFVEPQTDQINAQPGSWNIPYDSTLDISKITGYLDPRQGFYPGLGYRVVKFNIDSSGNASVIEKNDNLLLTRPTVGIEDEKNYEVARKYILEKIYPNPTNSQANITYNLPARNNISIDVYDMLGKKVNTLEKGFQESGPHEIKWNVNNQPSGIYNIILRNENQILDKKKITIAK